MNEIKVSPYTTSRDHCNRGELAYQVCTDDDKVIFYPRVASPGTASPHLQWKVSAGLGTVYATTTVHQKDMKPYNVALINVDEGFRMMSRVEDIESDSVKVGMRVKMRMHPGNEKQAPYPVFVPLEQAQ